MGERHENNYKRKYRVAFVANLLPDWLYRNSFCNARYGYYRLYNAFCMWCRVGYCYCFNHQKITVLNRFNYDFIVEKDDYDFIVKCSHRLVG